MLIVDEQLNGVLNENRLEEISNGIGNVNPPLPKNISADVYDIMAGVFAANDTMDAASYTMKGLNHNSGEPLSWDVFIINEKTRRYLEAAIFHTTVFDRKLGSFGTAFSVESLKDINTRLSQCQDLCSDIASVASQVLVGLSGDLSLSELSNLSIVIDEKVPKLPLMRRMWVKEE